MTVELRKYRWTSKSRKKEELSTLQGEELEWTFHV